MDPRELAAALGRERHEVLRFCGDLDDVEWRTTSRAGDVRWTCAPEPDELRDHILAVETFERGVAGQRCEQRGTETVDIRPNRRCASGQHFGRGEGRRSGHFAGAGLETTGDVYSPDRRRS